ncbi:hypothetical protein [Zooshikella sp. RANM57]|uniref:hypothetical protein n=1 Tax=Zooshikella sp. RANM57 TaxID=3425863 RepID=UPI003D6F0119
MDKVAKLIVFITIFCTVNVYAEQEKDQITLREKLLQLETEIANLKATSPSLDMPITSTSVGNKIDCRSISGVGDFRLCQHDTYGTTQGKVIIEGTCVQGYIQALEIETVVVTSESTSC